VLATTIVHVQRFSDLWKEASIKASAKQVLHRGAHVEDLVDRF